ncbi:hypothetical protein WR25_03049 [Diploscapter pachys]|uniref:Laminin EGF-like domain-containing protein n=1 Tax=Diploscapter pachys TaxID=2018661 RepID=A0A2A2L782_9BILA|nr:hypothetical protein WR25_03049 [Diploscapter pachys]
MELYGKLPAETKAEWDPVYRKMCYSWVEKVVSAEELNEFNALNEHKKFDEIKEKLNVYKERLSEEHKKMVDLWADACSKYQEPKHRRRDVQQQIEKHLSWLTPDQKAEIKKMTDEGKPRSEIQQKLFSFIDKMPAKEEKDKAKDETVKQCYAWMEKVATKKEIEDLHKLHEVDHDACKKRVREMIAKLDPTTKALVERRLPFCEKLWYGDHSSHGSHGGHDHHAHHHHKRRHVKRHLHVVEKYLDWLSPQQMEFIKELDKNNDFDKVEEKLTEYYKALPEAKRNEVRDRFREQCKNWAKEVALPEEWENIKKKYDAKDYGELKKLLVTLEDRLTENQKHTIEHARSICLRVWEIEKSIISRRRRDKPVMPTFEETSSKYLKWMTPEQLHDISKSKDDKNQLYDKVMQYFDQTTGVKREEAKEQLQGACREYLTSLIGVENVLILRKIRTEGATAQQLHGKLDDIVKVNKFDDEMKKRIKREAQNDASENERRLVATRKAVITELDRCTTWRSGLSDEKRNRMEQAIYSGKFEHFLDLALREARDFYPDSEHCLRGASVHLKKYRRNLNAKMRETSGTKNRIEDFLNIEQIKMLREHFEQNKNGSEKVTKMINYYFGDLSEERRQQLVQQLIQQFHDYKNLRRNPRVARSIPDSENSKPEPLKPEWLKWMTPRHKQLSNREKLATWDRLNLIGKFFYHLSKKKREENEKPLKEYCIRNIVTLIGNASYDELKEMYTNKESTAHIEAKYNEIVANLDSEQKRLSAGHYGAFCQKIFRLVEFEPTDLTSWMTAEQKQLIAKMIIDPKINDSEVYDKVYEFYKTAKNEEKDEAEDIVETGCRHFISHLLGEDVAEEIEELRVNGKSPQLLAAKLAIFAESLSKNLNAKTTESSLSICKRIYLHFDGTCNCNGHSQECGPKTHTCMNCNHNTTGILCEKCVDGYNGNAVTEEGCTEGAKEDELQSCLCHGHAQSCDANMKCELCEHNTEGGQCERCKPGFYGDAQKGQIDDCIKCPCPYCLNSLAQI